MTIDLTGLPSEFEDAFTILGDVGFYMAACRRHEIPIPEVAKLLAIRLGTALGTAPRLITAHMETENKAVDGTYRTFTSSPVERVFLDGNTRSTYAYMRAAEALRRILPLGISHPGQPSSSE